MESFIMKQEMKAQDTMAEKEFYLMEIAIAIVALAIMVTLFM